MFFCLGGIRLRDIVVGFTLEFEGYGMSCMHNIISNIRDMIHCMYCILYVRMFIETIGQITVDLAVYYVSISLFVLCKLHYSGPKNCFNVCSVRFVGLLTKGIKYVKCPKYLCV